MSRTSQRQLRYVRLPTPVLAKGVFNFYMPWLESIYRERIGLLSLELRPLKEQTAKHVSVGRDSAYRACLSWYFPTWPGVMSLAHTCIYPRHHLQYWRQWWHRIDDPINHKLSRPPCVSWCLSPPWRISWSDLVWPWCIRGLAHKNAELKASQDR